MTNLAVLIFGLILVTLGAGLLLIKINLRRHRQAIQTRLNTISETRCDYCNGRGRDEEGSRCQNCGGSGVIR